MEPSLRGSILAAFRGRWFSAASPAVAAPAAAELARVMTQLAPSAMLPMTEDFFLRRLLRDALLGVDGPSTNASTAPRRASAPPFAAAREVRRVLP